MAAFTVARERPDRPDVRALLDASDALMTSLYDITQNYLVDAGELIRQDAVFLVARADGRAIGCGALLRHDGYGEIKRVFVSEGARGRGIGRYLLAELETRAEGLLCLRLETGVRQPDAIALYRGAGFRETGPFGGYAPDAVSVFMEKRL